MASPFPASLLAVATLTAVAAEPASPRPLNVILMVADDLGIGDVGAYGPSLARTPNLDRLAREGMVATNARTVASVCTPLRYATLTGRYMFRHGRPWQGDSLVLPGHPTVASVFRDAGYQTAMFGKWHLGWGDFTEPARRFRADVDWNAETLPRGVVEAGFDTYFGVPWSHNEPPFVFVENRTVVGRDPADPIRVLGPRETPAGRGWGHGISEGGAAAHAARPEDQVDTLVTRRAVEYIESNAHAAFFMHLAFVAPHVPISPSPAFRGRSGKGPYIDFVEELDAHVGDVLAALERAGIADNTLVIFTSDNGGMYDRTALARHGHRPNGALLGQKTDAWEGGVAVPFLARLPGRIPAGTVTDFLLSPLDMMATLTSAAGIPAPARAVDSVDQWAVLTGTAREPARTELLQQGISGWAIRSGDWVFLNGQGSLGVSTDPRMTWAVQALAQVSVNSDLGPDGYVVASAPATQLYNVRLDPTQSRNVVAEHLDIAERLRARMRELGVLR
jgi:arylsulfatase A-like enzyme